MKRRCSTGLLAAVCCVALLAGCVSFAPGPLPDEPADGEYADLEQARVRYVDEGEGPAVVFLHGFGSSLEVWGEVMPEVRDERRTIALDLKGFGWSGRPEGDYSPQAEAELVFDLLDRLGVDDAAVVAHSWGASVALQMAQTQPDRVRRLALYGAWVYAEQLPATFYWARTKPVGEMLWSLFYRQLPNEKLAAAFYDRSEISQEYAEYARSLLYRPGTLGATLAAVRGQRFEKWQSAYSEVEQPTLLMWGREDGVAHLRYGERLVRQLPDAELEVYARCGHFPMREAKAASTEDLLEFLGRGRTSADEPKRTAERRGAR